MNRALLARLEDAVAPETVPAEASLPLIDEGATTEETRGLRITAVFVILLAGLLGGVPPLFIRSLRDQNSLTTFLIRAFAAGVILALALVHIVPEAIEELIDIGGVSYPVGGTCILFGLLIMVFIEHSAHLMYGMPHVHGPGGGGSHAHGATPPPPPLSHGAAAPADPLAEPLATTQMTNGAGGGYGAGSISKGVRKRSPCSGHEHSHSHKHELSGTREQQQQQALAAMRTGGYMPPPPPPPPPPTAPPPPPPSPPPPLVAALGMPAPSQQGVQQPGDGSCQHQHYPQQQSEQGEETGPQHQPLLQHPQLLHHTTQPPLGNHNHCDGAYAAVPGRPMGAAVTLVAGTGPPAGACFVRHSAGPSLGVGACAGGGTEGAGNGCASKAGLHACSLPLLGGKASACGSRYGGGGGGFADVAAAGARAEGPSGGGIAGSGSSSSGSQLALLLHCPPGHAHDCVSRSSAPNWVSAVEVTAEVGQPLRMRIIAYLFELGCIFHSFIIGLSLGVNTTSLSQVRALLIALSFHQALEGLSLASVINGGGFSTAKAALMVLMYSVTCPAGVAIGIAVAASYDPGSTRARAAQGCLNGVSGGMLLYISLVQLVAEDMGKYLGGGAGGGGGSSSGHVSSGVGAGAGPATVLVGSGGSEPQVKEVATAYAASAAAIGDDSDGIVSSSLTGQVSDGAVVAAAAAAAAPREPHEGVGTALAGATPAVAASTAQEVLGSCHSGGGGGKGEVGMGYGIRVPSFLAFCAGAASMCLLAVWA